ncbi:MAG: hypothetical protein JJT76_06910 [Clostridiaceae bacterium]|nr:hypothetical protein [Clostridiaceae bacterium]
MGKVLKDVALILTECDIKRFNQYLIILKHPSILVHEKYESALFVKGMNEALKVLQEKVNERDFKIFYYYYFESWNRNDIADTFEVDVSTITRNRNKVLKELSIILYPDLNMIDMVS